MNSRKLIIIVGAVFGVILLLLLLALVLVGSKGCTPKGSAKCKKPTGNSKITLTYWRPFDDTDKFQKVIDDYEKQHSNITIDYRKQDPATYDQQLIQNFAGGGGPDLFSINNTWLPKYQNLITAAPDGEVDMTDVQRNFFPVVQTDGVINGKLYALPYSVETLALFENTGLLAKGQVYQTPESWSDITGDKASNKPGMISALTVRNGTSIQQSAIALGSSKVSRAQDILALMMLEGNRNVMTTPQHDKAIFDLSMKDDNGKDVFYGQQALALYTSFSNPSSPNYTYNADIGDSLQAFAQGKVAMMLGYAHDIARLHALNPDLQYDVKPVPQLTPGDPTNYANYQTEVVSKQSKHPKEAWDFIKFVASKDRLEEYTDAVSLPPSRKDVGTSGQYVDVFYKQSPTAVDWYVGDYSTADQIFLKMITDVIGGVPVDTATKQGATDETANLLKIKNGGSPKPSQ